MKIQKNGWMNFMKIIKIIILATTLIILVGCGTNNNNPVVEERPFEDVNIEEANVFFSDVIFEEENLRQFFKDKILLDYSELDQINQDNFEISDLILIDPVSNEFQITFYHHFSNYNLSLNVFLDKEEDQLVVYNVKVTESTYEYMTEDFIQMHIDNVITYLENDDLSTKERCARFDVTNELCEGLTQVIDSLQYTLLVNNIQNHDSYYIVAFNLESDDNILHFSTEIEIGINDEGSFVYDLSYLHPFSYDPEDIELFDKYETRMMRMINDLNKGAISYNDACDTYFYGEYDCLEGLSAYDDAKDNQMVYRYFLLDELFYKLYVDYNPSHSFVKDEILYRAYTTENGNIFMHPVSSKNNTNMINIEDYYKNLLLNMLTHVPDTDFCDNYSSLMPNCHFMKEEINTLNMTMDIDEIVKTENKLQVTFNFKDPVTDDFYHYYVVYDVAAILNEFGYLINMSSESYHYYFGVDKTKLHFEEYLEALGDSTISNEEIRSKYQSFSLMVYDVYLPSLRENFKDVDVTELVSNWTYSRLYDGEIQVYPYFEDNTLGRLNPMLILMYENGDGNYFLELHEAFTQISPVENTEATVAALEERFTNLTLSNEEACALEINNDYLESTCSIFRTALMNPELSYKTYIIEPSYDFFPQQVTFLFYNTLTGDAVHSFTFEYQQRYMFTNTPVTVTNMGFTTFGKYFSSYYYRSLTNLFTDNLHNSSISDSVACKDVSNYDYCVSLRNKLLEENISIVAEVLIRNNLDNLSEFMIAYEFSDPVYDRSQLIIYTDSTIINGELVIKLHIEEWDEVD